MDGLDVAVDRRSEEGPDRERRRGCDNAWGGVEIWLALAGRGLLEAGDNFCPDVLEISDVLRGTSGEAVGVAGTGNPSGKIMLVAGSSVLEILSKGIGLIRRPPPK